MFRSNMYVVVIEVYENNVLWRTHKFDPTGKRIYISILILRHWGIRLALVSLCGGI